MGAQIGAAFAAVLMVMLLTGLSACHRLHEFREAVSASSRTYNVIADLDKATLEIADQEAALRGYLLGADPKFLESYQNAGEAFLASLARLRGLIADDATQLKRLNRLQDLAESWHRDVAEEEIALMDKPETVRDARRLETAGAGKVATEGVRSLAMTLKAVELQRL
ncbi:MAG TPA: CHASE3 domain-containing protein, partial [Rhodospirillales bacterium]|nr:CHASE3 domain-containing protein [Rhodospirillales bacterium]